jgi:glycosyltransferase involved in cell wall biosynthesis
MTALTSLRTVLVVVPEGVDDPARPSGGNAYDRRVCRGLAGAGWAVREEPVPGSWPDADGSAHRSLAELLGAAAAGTTVLLDGLVASGAPDVLVPHASRLRLVVLLHLPLGVTSLDSSVGAGERAVLEAATAVLTTSRWTRRWLLDSCGLPADRVHVAEPGVDPAPLSAGSRSGDRLLCVAAVTPLKGHDVLLEALAGVSDLSWTCDCVGSLDRDPVFVQRLRRRAGSLGLADRFHLRGPRSGARLGACYRSADALVLASRFETYGMVVTEALARALPVLATSVGGLPETLDVLPDGSRAGLLVTPEDPAALAAALRRWLDEDDLRSALRAAARRRRTDLAGWDETIRSVSRVLAEVAA